MFPGDQLPSYLGTIKQFVDLYKATSLLDYGAGKAVVHKPNLTIEIGEEKFVGLRSYFGFERIASYEPGLGQPLPQERFDIVICLDVLEHCFFADIPWIVEEIFSLADRVVFVTVACVPAFTLLPNGENAHTTLRRPDWWIGLFEATANHFPAIDFLLGCVTDNHGGPKAVQWYRRQSVETLVSENTHFGR